MKVRIGRLSDFGDAIRAEKPELPVVRGDMPRDSSAVMLRDWFLTGAGQATIEESGYVPIR